MQSEINAIATTKPEVIGQTHTPYNNEVIPHSSHDIIKDRSPKPVKIQAQANSETVSKSIPNKLSEVTDSRSDTNKMREPQEIPSKYDKMSEDKNEVQNLTSLKDNYRRAALIAKKCGQQDVALSHIKTAKVYFLSNLSNMDLTI